MTTWYVKNDFISGSDAVVIVDHDIYQCSSVYAN